MREAPPPSSAGGVVSSSLRRAPWGPLSRRAVVRSGASCKSVMREAPPPSPAGSALATSAPGRGRRLGDPRRPGPGQAPPAQANMSPNLTPPC